MRKNQSFWNSVYEPMFLTWNVLGRILLESRKFTYLAAKWGYFLPAVLTETICKETAVFKRRILDTRYFLT